MEDYFVVAFDESTRRFMHRTVSSTSKKDAINDFERYYENCTVVNIIGLLVTERRPTIILLLGL